MPRAIRYDRLPTEQRHPRSGALDRLPLSRLLALMAHQDAQVVRAVMRERPRVARAIRLMTQALAQGGRLFFLGAGTSGRLGAIEAAECPPTFQTPPSLVQAVIAGGPAALRRSREGAEDDRASARQTVRRRVRAGDVVVGITASGVTPFVDEGLRAAVRRGAYTVLVSCHPSTKIPARVRITPHVGPEVLCGSTRLKAGTATKLILNMLTLGTMTKLGKTYGNLMVDVRPTSRKLHARAVRIVQVCTHSSRPQAARALRAAHGDVKVAVLMHAQGLAYSVARRRLREGNGSLRRALHRRR